MSAATDAPRSPETPGASAVDQGRTRTTRGPAAWLRNIDPWGPVLAVAALGIFLLRGFGGVLSRDLALYAYAGQQFAEGVPPYVGVLNRAGPLAHMVPGIGARIARAIGTDDLLTMRVVMLALTVAAVWLAYLLGRDTFGSRVAGAVTAATLVSFHALSVYATGGPREKTTMLLLVVCALLAVAHRRWGWAGAAVALATLTWQPAFWLGLTAGVVAAGGPSWRRAWRTSLARWTRFAVGGLTATALVIAYFAAVGALADFLDGFLFLNATSTRQVGLLEFLREVPGEMWDAYGWSLVLLVTGLLASVALAVRSRGTTDPGGRVVVGSGAATVISFLWSLMVFNGWADAVFVLPLAALGVAGTLHLATRRLDGRRATRLLTAYVVVVLVATATTNWLTRPQDLGPMRAETEAMLEAAGPDVSVLSVGAPQPLVFGQLTNPLQHQMYIGGLGEYLDEEWPGGLEAMAAVVERDRPTFITMDHPTWYAWLHPTLEEDYVEVGTTQLFTWYADRSLGEDRIEAFERILDRGP